MCVTRPAPLRTAPCCLCVPGRTWTSRPTHDPRAQSGPRRKMPSGREPDHIRADLRDDHLRGPITNAGDRLEEADRFNERGDHFIDVGLEPVNRQDQLRARFCSVVVEDGRSCAGRGFRARACMSSGDGSRWPEARTGPLPLGPAVLRVRRSAIVAALYLALGRGWLNDDSARDRSGVAGDVPVVPCGALAACKPGGSCLPGAFV